MPRPEVENGNGKIAGFGVDGGGKELAKKSGKSKGQNLSKSQKLAKSGKSLPKSENSPNFDATEAGSNYLIPGARETFNCLWLTFTKAPIF